MLKKGFKDLLAEANAAVDCISVTTAQELAGRPDVVFVDVREGHEWAEGHIPGAVHAPRGLLEFIAAPDGPLHNPELIPQKTLVLYCGTGARSAFAAKTLKDMGFPDVRSMVGGIGAWRQAGGEIAR
ncbi:MAG: rhodanese-like domain-containing protein [Alphaproteobacteria bacterium]|nr:MAG: rhodanese-like domain-containing protein [Alphaproteobacteria bacterium]